uniref:Uncharacterized protein n=1 Tax=Vitis vinifera TaxID=29760 RepID=F6HFP1_VITVI
MLKRHPGEGIRTGDVHCSGHEVKINLRYILSKFFKTCKYSQILFICLNLFCFWILFMVSSKNENILYIYYGALSLMKGQVSLVVSQG